MILSMTGYGKAEARITGGRITLEIRSLNAKGADINLKTSLIPKEKDLPVRKRLAERLVRGTIDLYATFEPDAATAKGPFNADAARSYLEEARSLLSGDPDAAAEATLLSAILRLPDVADKTKGDVVGESDWPAVESALETALDQLYAYRQQEGAALYADVTARVGHILSFYEKIEALEGERLETVKARLLKNLEEAAQKPDPARFEQELIFYLEKYDINEEKVRLRQHCRYFLETIDTEPYPGKKLGFIIQEMGREINTTGSKANHAGIQRLVVRAKDELEKIREQSMNIL